MDNFKHFKKPKIKVFNEKGVWIRKCPRCCSTRLRTAAGRGFYCENCKFLHKRRLTDNLEEVGKVSYVTY